jgi:hypothetical protein
MTLHAYRNEENRSNRAVFLILAQNSFDPFQTSHGNNYAIFSKIKMIVFVLKISANQKEDTEIEFHNLIQLIRK